MKKVSSRAELQPGLKFPARLQRPAENLSPGKRAEKPHVIAFSITVRAESELADSQWWFSTKEKGGHDNYSILKAFSPG